MAQKDYSHNESLERIYTMLSGGADPSDTSGTLGQTAWQESLAKIAQLLEGSLGDASFNLPDAVVADVAEANAGTSDDVILTPQSHSWAHEYGGIYITTGTVAQAFPQTTWTQITGAFQGEMDNSGEVDGDYNDDRIVINETGDYFVQYQLSMWVWGGTPTVVFSLYNDGAAAGNSRASLTFGASGTVSSVHGMGIITVTSGTAVDVRCSFSAGATAQVDYGQLTAVKMVG